VRLHLTGTLRGRVRQRGSSALAIDVARYKLLAFPISAGYAAVIEAYLGGVEMLHA
jgi:hypothetical protein